MLNGTIYYRAKTKQMDQILKPQPCYGYEVGGAYAEYTLKFYSKIYSLLQGGKH